MNIISEKIIEAKRKRAKACLNELLDNNDPEIYKDLTSAAMVMASKIVMQHYDLKGIAHCFDCHMTDQLRQSLKGYVCPRHWKGLTKVEELEIVGGSSAV